ncbi:MAG: amidase [Actinomycetes bacterium]
MTRPSLAPDLCANTAYSLSEAIAAGEVSCVEVISAHLDRIEALEGRHHCMVSLRPREEVLREAAERDQQLARGESRGWMHGLPHAVKDLSDVRGLPTTSGFVRVEEAPVASEDSLLASRVRGAGAVFVGKTNTPEHGLGSHTYNSLGPPTGNALDPRRTAGGSSGGAAVAVALGMVPVADGSDFMGSLRNPPGWNEVLGLRPTPGRVPNTDDDVFSVPGGVDGPIARNSRDLALLLATMSGHDRHDPLSLADDPQLLLDGLDCELDALRIGWLADLGGYLATEPGVLDTCVRALGTWSSAGATVEPVELPKAKGFRGVEDLWPAWLTLRHLQVGAGLEFDYDEDALGRMKPEARWEVEGFHRLTVDDVVRSARTRSGLYRSFLALFDEFDVVALPSAQVWPFPVDHDWPHTIAGAAMDTYHRWMEVTVPATMAGLPVLVVPAGRGAEGLPMGLQLIGPARSESLLLRIAAHGERHGLVRTVVPSALP